jgi:imidazolonepropionase-like amidohydrolase
LEGDTTLRLILTNANVIDCVNLDPKTLATVIIENGRILEIRDGGPPTNNSVDRVINLAGSYLIPGLWDVHIHPEHPVPAGTTVAQITADFGQNLQRGMIEAGVTAVRSGGARDFMDVAWRNAFSGPGAAGPRVFACGNFLTTTGGHFLTSGHARECDGPYGYAEAIRDQMKHDVDHIKLNLTGGIMGPRWDRHTESFLLPEEIETAFALCRQRNFPVMAHATNPEAVKMAIKLGAHSVEHAYITDEDCITDFVSSGTWYVPTLSISQLSPNLATTEHEKAWAAQKQLAPDLVIRADTAAAEHRSSFQKALSAGVKMALGSDISPMRESALLELGLWVKCGATPWQALTAATKNAAEMCGVGPELGTVEPGKLADLIVVDGNPLDDIENIRNLELVMREGRVVADHRG